MFKVNKEIEKILLKGGCLFPDIHNTGCDDCPFNYTNWLDCGSYEDICMVDYIDWSNLLTTEQVDRSKLLILDNGDKK